MSSPSVTISLAPDGSLQLHLPGSAGDRIIPLRETSTCSPSATIRRVLEEQARGSIALGTDGAPTRQQLQHWERHQTFPDSRCPFCAAQSSGVKSGPVHRSSHQFDARFAPRSLPNGVVIRRVPTGQTAKGLEGKVKSGEARERAKASRANAFKANRPSGMLNF